MITKLKKVDKLQKILNDFSSKLVNEGVCEYIIVITHDQIPHGGMSKTKTIDGNNSPIKLLRKTLEDWEKRQGLDPDNDWGG